MGAFTYEHVRFDLDDRLLAHLQHVIYNKLRRGESMAFTWTDVEGTAGGRTSVWIHPGATVVFEFAGGTSVDLNRVWLERLTVAANSPAGLHPIPEPVLEDVAR